MEKLFIKATVVLGIIVVLLLVVFYWGFHRMRAENERISVMLHQTQQQYKTEKGKNVTVTQQLSIKQSEIRDMKRRASRDSSRLTDQEKRILSDLNIIDELKKKLGNVSSITSGTITAGTEQHTGYTITKWRDRYIPLIDTIKDKHWLIAFQADTLGSLKVTPRYTNRFYIILDRQKLHKDGDPIKHPKFPWYWFRDWDYFATATSEDTSATISNVLNMNF